MITPDVSVARNEVALNESAERLTVAIELARRYPNARVLFSGGSGALLFSEGNEAEVAGRLLQGFGIAPGRILLEQRARNTVENAAYSKAMAQPTPGERWLLVTSAFHMPRSIGVFRQAGFTVEAFPVDWRTRGSEDAAAIRNHGRRAQENRHRRARVGRPRGVLALRQVLGTIPAARPRPGCKKVTNKPPSHASRRHSPVVHHLWLKMRFGGESLSLCPQATVFSR